MTFQVTTKTPSATQQPAATRLQHLDKLVAAVYRELQGIAHRHMCGEHQGHTLQTTALVNEAYLRLRGLKQIEWRDSSHFFSVAAGIMRRILVDQARASGSSKRGGNALRVTLDEHSASTSDDVDLVMLDTALERLSERDEVQAKIVELRYFAGLSIAETAAMLTLSPATVKRKWALAQAWLFHELSADK